MTEQLEALRAFLAPYPWAYTLVVASALVLVAWLANWITKRVLLRGLRRLLTTLPLGLTFLNASIEPQQFGRNLNWVTEAILPGEGRYIEYRVRALSDGRYVSTATVESHPLDGSEGASSSVAASIVVGNETTVAYSEDGWRPPEWGLDRSDVFDSIIDTIAGDDTDSSSCTSESCPV